MDSAQFQNQVMVLKSPTLKFYKSNKYFYLLAASIYNSLAKFEKAAEAYETMIAEVKGTDDYLYELAAVYQYANKPNDAIASGYCRLRMKA